MEKHFGDSGMTKLLSGNIVSKASLIIKIEGKLDLISALIQEIMVMATNNKVFEHFVDMLGQMTNLLVYFSNPNDMYVSCADLYTEKMDKFIAEHKKEHNFKYFSNLLSCKINILRTFVRELESLAIKNTGTDNVIITFINRLSLYIFYLACDAEK